MYQKIDHEKFGYQLLAAIPKNRLFQLFVDGEFHNVEQGWKQFELREPGCLKAFFNALQFALTDLDQQIDVNFILEIQQIVTASVNNVGVIPTERLRNCSRTSFDIPADRMTTRGLKELILNARTLQLVPDKLVDKNNIDLLQDTRDIEEIVNSHQNESLRYTAPTLDEYTMKVRIENIVKCYHQEMSISKTKDEQLYAMVKCAKSLELLHPFHDANGRTFINILLNKMLLQNNFPPVIFYNPNIFDLYSIDELVDIVKEGMKYTFFVIENPNDSLFGYNANTMPKEEKAELEQITLDFCHFLNTRITDPNQEKQKLLTYLKEMNTYLDKSFSTEQRIFIECALGNEAAVDAYLEANSDILIQAGKHCSLLYRDLTLSHVAARTNQLSIFKKLVQHDTIILKHSDGRGRIPLMLAVYEKHANFVQFYATQNFYSLEELCFIKDKYDASVLEYIYLFSDKAIFEEFFKNSKTFFNENRSHQQLLQFFLKEYKNTILVDYYIDQYGIDDFIKNHLSRIATTFIRKNQSLQLPIAFQGQ